MTWRGVQRMAVVAAVIMNTCFQTSPVHSTATTSSYQFADSIPSELRNNLTELAHCIKTDMVKLIELRENLSAARRADFDDMKLKPFGALDEDWERLELMEQLQPDNSHFKDKIMRFYRILLSAFSQIDTKKEIEKNKIYSNYKISNKSLDLNETEQFVEEVINEIHEIFNNDTKNKQNNFQISSPNPSRPFSTTRNAKNIISTTPSSKLTKVPRTTQQTPKKKVGTTAHTFHQIRFKSTSPSIIIRTLSSIENVSSSYVKQSNKLHNMTVTNWPEPVGSFFRRNHMDSRENDDSIEVIGKGINDMKTSPINTQSMTPSSVNTEKPIPRHFYTTTSLVNAKGNHLYTPVSFQDLSSVSSKEPRRSRTDVPSTTNLKKQSFTTEGYAKLKTTNGKKNESSKSERKYYTRNDSSFYYKKPLTEESKVTAAMNPKSTTHTNYSTRFIKQHETDQHNQSQNDAVMKYEKMHDTTLFEENYSIQQGPTFPYTTESVYYYPSSTTEKISTIFKISGDQNETFLKHYTNAITPNSTHLKPYPYTKESTYKSTPLNMETLTLSDVSDLSKIKNVPKFQNHDKSSMQASSRIEQQFTTSNIVNTQPYKENLNTYTLSSVAEKIDSNYSSMGTMPINADFYTTQNDRYTKKITEYNDENVLNLSSSEGNKFTKPDEQIKIFKQVADTKMDNIMGITGSTEDNDDIDNWVLKANTELETCQMESVTESIMTKNASEHQENQNFSSNTAPIPQTGQVTESKMTGNVSERQENQNISANTAPVSSQTELVTDSKMTGNGSESQENQNFSANTAPVSSQMEQVTESKITDNGGEHKENQNFSLTTAPVPQTEHVSESKISENAIEHKENQSFSSNTVPLSQSTQCETNVAGEKTTSFSPLNKIFFGIKDSVALFPNNTFTTDSSISSKIYNSENAKYTPITEVYSTMQHEIIKEMQHKNDSVFQFSTNQSTFVSSSTSKPTGNYIKIDDMSGNPIPVVLKILDKQHSQKLLSQDSSTTKHPNLFNGGNSKEPETLYSEEYSKHNPRQTTHVHSTTLEDMNMQKRNSLNYQPTTARIQTNSKFLQNVDSLHPDDLVAEFVTGSTAKSPLAENVVYLDFDKYTPERNDSTFQESPANKLVEKLFYPDVPTTQSVANLPFKNNNFDKSGFLLNKKLHIQDKNEDSPCVLTRRINVCENCKNKLKNLNINWNDLEPESINKFMTHMKMKSLLAADESNNPNKNDVLKINN